MKPNNTVHAHFLKATVAAGALGVLHFLVYLWYNRKGQINAIQVPGLGRLDLDE